MVRAFEECGVSVQVVSMSDCREPKDQQRRGFWTAGNQVNWWTKIKFGLKVCAELLFKRYTFIVCGHVHFAALVGFLAWIRRRKFIVSIYGTDAWKVRNRLEAFFVRRAALILSSGMFTANEASEVYQLSRERFSILPCPIDPSLQSNEGKLSETVQNFLRGKKVLLSVGRVEKWSMAKGYLETIDAVAKLRERDPALVYVIVGGGDGQALIRERLKQIGLEPFVMLTGYVSDQELAAFYRACDIFVLPSVMIKQDQGWSEGEGFGIVFIEAAYWGKPAVAVDEGGVSEAVEEGVTGLLVKPNRADELSAAIEKLLLDSELRRKMGEAARNRAREVFSYETFKSRVAEIMARVGE